MEFIVIGLLYGGGIVVAAILMLLATFLSKSVSGRAMLIVLAAIGMLAQGGCWHIAAGIGRATSGSGGGGMFAGILMLSGVVFVVWTLGLFATADGAPGEGSGTKDTEPLQRTPDTKPDFSAESDSRRR